MSVVNVFRMVFKYIRFYKYVWEFENVDLFFFYKVIIGNVKVVGLGRS